MADSPIGTEESQANNVAKLREAIRATQRANKAAGGIPIGEFAKTYDVPGDLAYDVYMEEAELYRRSPEGKASTRRSSRWPIYAGLLLFLIPPISVALLWIGMADLAESKGYDRALGALSLAHVFGLVIVICLPNKVQGPAT